MAVVEGSVIGSAVGVIVGSTVGVAVLSETVAGVVSSSAEAAPMIGVLDITSKTVVKSTNICRKVK